MPGSIQSIERAAAMLRLLGSGPLGLADLAGALALPKPTAHGIVRTLCDVGFVEQDPSSGHYLLSVGFTELGRVGVDGNVLRSRAMNWTDRLASHLGMTVHLGVPHQGEVEVVHHVFRPEDVTQHLEIGQTRPLHATALGKVVMAFVPGAGPAQGARLERYCVGTRTHREELVEELVVVRHQGWAVEAGEFRPGVAGLAAPIRGTGGVTVAAVAVSAPQEALLEAGRRPRRGLVDAVVRTAREVTRELAIRR